MSQVRNTYIGSILLDFPVKSDLLSGKDSDNEELLDGPVAKILQARFGQTRKIISQRLDSSKYGRIAVFVAEKGVTATLRTYPERSQVTLSVEYDLKEFDGVAPMKYDDIKEMEAELTKQFFTGNKPTKAIPQVKRALSFDTYFTTSDDRLLEYDIQEMLFDEKSAFQHVQIGRSINYGNVLILDDLVNLAEGDLTYTESIMCRGKVDYTGKDILILGGGDGGLLNELRKENAKSITMIEIDDVVMKACKVYLRGACDDTLDNYKIDNYEIIVGDCIPFMLKCQEEGRIFDFIFGDLTDIPICQEPEGELWNFIQKILKLSFAILKPDGTYFTHANGISSQGSLEMFKKVIQQALDYPVDISSSSTFVPSFKEKWVFYQVKRIIKS